MANLSIIVALAEDRVIGKENKLPWHIPRDLRNFRELTVGKPIIMGRKTFESIGRPLAQRANIVVTRDVHFSAPGVHIARDVDAAIDIARKVGGITDSREIMVIGGEQIFELVLQDAARMYMTKVLTRVPGGDAWFPKFDEQEWKVSSHQVWEQGEGSPFECEYRVLER